MYFVAVGAVGRNFVEIVGEWLEMLENLGEPPMWKTAFLSTHIHSQNSPFFFHRIYTVDMEKIVDNFGENVETPCRPLYLVELMLVMMALTVSA